MRVFNILSKDGCASTKLDLTEINLFTFCFSNLNFQCFSLFINSVAIRYNWDIGIYLCIGNEMFYQANFVYNKCYGLCIYRHLVSIYIDLPQCFCVYLWFCVK
uniref:Uncharacterized protein n=1 Tax=Octopus bimaculoides TaxID=37653 RepID=A0A0L8HIA9_OCTBM